MIVGVYPKQEKFVTEVLDAVAYAGTVAGSSATVGAIKQLKGAGMGISYGTCYKSKDDDAVSGHSTRRGPTERGGRHGRQGSPIIEIPTELRSRLPRSSFIFQFSRWIFEADAEIAFEIFFSDDVELLHQAIVKYRETIITNICGPYRRIAGGTRCLYDDCSMSTTSTA
ncbi:hypothetical protein NP233_g10082 [Leucocoprinus birnbaumii]|uniref:Uncharacterized protein n=1 Tax=Leucocoprinus birnbaumii TaxID=56174 RepID=A0AAD5VJN5_9AGAR|nr:hypothetical protein NP233_g10082 [Leucocoprinus birnbaumii]